MDHKTKLVGASPCKKSSKRLDHMTNFKPIFLKVGGICKWVWPNNFKGTERLTLLYVYSLKGNSQLIWNDTNNGWYTNIINTKAWHFLHI